MFGIPRRFSHFIHAMKKAKIEERLKVASFSQRSFANLGEPKSLRSVLYPPQGNGSGHSLFNVGHFDAVKVYPILEPFFVERLTGLKYF
jgi:hypothetical protein